jgi:Tol biopolymer transport system component
MSSELREVFEMVTKQTEPEPDARWEQEQRQRRRSRNRKLGALAIATTIGIVAVVVSLVSLSRTAEPPADEPTPRPTPARLGSLAYAVRGDIYVADWDGSDPVRIADGRPPSDCHDVGEYSAQGPIWSPDGRYLAYRHMDCNAPAFQTPGSWWDVVISDAEGNVVTSFPSEGWGISWSPDSTRVVVWVRWGEEPRTIGIYGPDGERQMLLMPDVTGGGEADPVWSPDGESLLLGNFEIPLDGSTPRPLPIDGIRRTYSPDGSRVAYNSRSSYTVRPKPTRSSLVIAAADGSHPQVFGDRVGSIAWSPTGDRIAFTSWNGTELRLLDVATGTVTLLTKTDGSDMLGGPFEFSPEGDRILFSKTEVEGAGAGSLWSVNADGSDLRRLVTGTASGDWLSPSQTR